MLVYIYIYIYIGMHLIKMQLSVHLQLLHYIKLNSVAFKAEKREQMTITPEVQEI
jgi:hypothetical protein